VATRGGIREVTHGGATAGYRTWLARFPARRTSVAVLCNVASANATSLGNQAVSAIMPRPAAIVASVDTLTLTDDDLARYTGLFRAPGSENLIRIVTKNGKLATELPFAATPIPVASDRFRIGQQELVYRRDGGRLRDVIFVNDGDTTVYEPMIAAAPSAAQLASYAGSYWSDELETRVKVVVRDGGLVLQQRLESDTKLTPTYEDAFTSPSGSIVFTRDEQGAVTGFGIWAGRIRNVRFRKEGQ
jgi:hypothetical protein